MNNSRKKKPFFFSFLHAIKTKNKNVVVAVCVLSAYIENDGVLSLAVE